MDRTGRTLWSSPSPGVALSGPFPDPGWRNSESSGGGLTRWTAALCRRTAGLRGRGVPGDLSHPPGEGAHDLALDLGVLLEQVMEVLAREDEDAQRRLGSDGGGAWNLLDKGDLADEVAGAARADAAALALDLGLALDDHEELMTELALLGQGGALGNLQVLADASELGELLFRQPLEQWGPLECLDLGVLTEEPHRAPSLFGRGR